MKDNTIKPGKGKSDTLLMLAENRIGVLYKIAYSHFKNSDKACDTVQGTLLYAYEKIGSLRDIPKFNSWITSILVNRCRDLLRRRNRHLYDKYCDDTSNFARFKP